MPLISPRFAVKSIIFPNFGPGPFHKITGKSPGVTKHAISNQKQAEAKTFTRLSRTKRAF